MGPSFASVLLGIAQTLTKHCHGILVVKNVLNDIELVMQSSTPYNASINLPPNGYLAGEYTQPANDRSFPKPITEKPPR